MDEENRCPTLESLLQDMIANQQTLHETFEEFNERLKKIEAAVDQLESAETMELEDDEDEEELYQAAVAVVRDKGKASTSFLQRTFKIGYSRAAVVMDKMEMNGVIGPQNGSRPREVFSDD
jgi:S-DNA-T family DNA segregation ATPase FtsK/SpoIIIE